MVHVRRVWLAVASVGLAVTVAQGCRTEEDDLCHDGRCECQGRDDCEIVCVDQPCDVDCNAVNRCEAACLNDCDLDCNDLDDCDVECENDCEIDCTSLTGCEATCGERCDYTCHSVSRCEVTVGPDSVVDCFSISSCDVDCIGPCEVECSNAGSCDITCYDRNGESPMDPVVENSTFTCPDR